MSEIVIAETKNKYREQLEEAMKKANAGIRELQRFGFSSTYFNENKINEVLSEYTEFIDFFIIESGMTIPEPYPVIAHNIIVERALARKKPFKNDGKNGYRDFLVWHTFLDFVNTCGNNDDFIFVTLNKNDFSDEKDAEKLHCDLLADIENMNLLGKRILYYASLNDFIEKVIKPKLKTMEEKTDFTTNLLDKQEDFVNPIENYVLKELANFDVNSFDVFPDGENPEVSSLDDVEIDEISDVSKVSDDEYLVTVRVTAHCLIESHLLKSDLAAMSRKEIRKISITNSDLNERFALVENEVMLNIDVEVLLELKDTYLKINSIEIQDISDASYCPFCSYDDEDEDEEDDVE